MSALLKKLLSIIVSAVIAFGSLNGVGSLSELRDILNNLFSEDSITKLYTLNKNDISYYEKEDLRYINNIVLVYFDDGVSEDRRKEIANSVDGEYAGEIGIIDQWQIRIPDNNLKGILAICDKLQEFSEVIAATFDFIADDVSPDYIPSDTWGNSSWQTPANASGYNWYAEKINATGAWDYNKYFKNQVKIGIVDDEIDAYQEDLDGRVFYVSDEVEARSEVNGTHGTGVCGIVSATPNNNLGTTGLAWNSKIFAYDWDDGNTLNTSTTILAGFTSCVDEGKCKIVNFSIGCTSSLDGDMDAFSLGAWDIGICSAMSKLLNAGYDFLVVQSAGNGNKNNIGMDAKNNGLFCSIGKSSLSSAYSSRYKEFLNHVIIVGASNVSNGKPSWSNYGSTVDIYAPGSDIYMTASNSSGYSYYKTASGTSFSAPIVSGVAGIISSINPSLTATEIKKIICNSDNSTYSVSGYGNIIDAKLCAEAAIASLPKADYTALDAAIAKSPAHNQAYYTASSWTAYSDALNNARNVSRNLLSEEQNTVDSAALALTKAYNLLAQLADYTELNSAIKLAQSLNENLYVDFSAVQTNLNAALKVPNDLAKNRQNSIDSIVSRLTNSINSLMLISEIFPNYFESSSSSETVIDTQSGLIYGLAEGLNSEKLVSDFITVHDGGSLDATPKSGNVLGTGSTVTLFADGKEVKKYKIVVFGDVNSDGICDGSDATIVSLLAYNLISPDSVSFETLLAADCNHDGTVNFQDVELLEKSGLCLDRVNQKS